MPGCDMENRVLSLVNLHGLSIFSECPRKLKDEAAGFGSSELSSGPAATNFRARR